MATDTAIPTLSPAAAEESGPVRTGRDRLAGEIQGVLALSLALLLLLSLLSYRPETTADGVGGNWVGPVGNFLADTLFFSFGLGAFLFALIAGALAISILRGRSLFERWGEGGGLTLLLTATTSLFHLVAPSLTLFGHPAGGLVGRLVGDALHALFGAVGGIVLGVSGVGVGLLLYSGLSIAESADRWAGRWSAWRAARAALRAERESVAAERANGTDAEPEVTRSGSVRLALPPLERTGEASEEATPVFASTEHETAPRPGQLEIPFARRLTSLFRLRRGGSGVTSPVSEPVPGSDAGDGGGDEAARNEPAWASGAGDELRAGEAPVEAPAPGRRSRSARGSRPGGGGPAMAGWFRVEAPEDDVIAADVVEISDARDEEAGSERGALPGTASEPPPSEFPIVEAVRTRKRPPGEGLQRAQQQRLPLAGADAEWAFPTLDLLDYRESAAGRADPRKLHEQGAQLVRALSNYGVRGEVVNACAGPVVTTFELKLEEGQRANKIIGLANDIGMAIKAQSIRITTIPGRGCLGIEIPSAVRETVYLKEILATEEFAAVHSRLAVALGKNAEGRPVVADLAKMPHLLVAGTTGSGKSVAVNAMIMSLLYNASPDDLRLILIDPKMVEFAPYEGAPHLLLPVVADAAKAVTALQWAVNEMERRYLLLQKLGVRNIGGYNEKLATLRKQVASNRADEGVHALLDECDATGNPMHGHLPFLVIVIDEVADLMAQAKKDVEIAVQRIAQKARAAGVHLILATQRPSVDVITGTIKSNLPTRMSFRLMSGTDSRTILDGLGAEQLLGNGDLLFRPPGKSDLTRVQAPFVTEDEIEKVVSVLRSQRAAQYDESILATPSDDEGGSGSGGGGGDPGPVDPKYDEALRIVLEAGYASISMLQRTLGLGYNRGARIIERMEREGIVGASKGGAGRRDVLMGNR